MGEEGAAAAGALAERADGLGVGIFVRDAPDVLEGDLVGCVLLLIDDFVAVAAEEGLHVVEIAVAAVEVEYVVALVAQHGARGVHAGVAGAFDDALSGTGRQRERHGFQSAYRAVARGEEPVEDQRLAAERIEAGREAVGTSVARHERCAHAFERYEHDVGVPFLVRRGDVTVILPFAPVFVVDECRGPVFGQRAVELHVVEFVFEERLVELIESVGLQFVVVDVVARLEPRVEGQHPQGDARHGQIDRRGDEFPPAGFERLGDADVAAEEPPRDGDGQRDDQRRQRDDRVGLHDVAHHLVRVDQIVHGDEVVAHAEFVPEIVFADGVEEDRADVDREQRGQPSLRPQRLQPRHEEPQGEAAGPVAQHDRGDERRCAAVFVEDRVAEGDVAKRRRQYAEQDVSRRAVVFPLREREQEEPQEDIAERQGAEVVQGAQSEDGDPLEEAEAQLGGLFVEQQNDAQQRADDERQRCQPQVDSEKTVEILRHGVMKNEPENARNGLRSVSGMIEKRLSVIVRCL